MTDFKVVISNNPEDAAKFSAMEAFYKEKLKSTGTIEERKPVDSRLGYVRRSPPKEASKNTHLGHTNRKFHGFQHGKRRLINSKMPRKFADRNVSNSMKVAPPKYGDHDLIGDSIMMRMAKVITNLRINRTHLCRGGMTSDDLKKEILRSPEFTPQKVCISVGGNDMLKHVPINKVVNNVLWIVRVLKKRGCQETLLMSVPPMAKYGDNSHLNGQIKELNEWLKEMSSDEINVKMAETNDVFYNPQEQLRFDLYERFYYNGRRDLIHPNEKGLRMIWEKLQIFM